MDNDGCCGARVSVFDELPANHFRAIDRISQLCGGDPAAIDDAEVQRFSSSVTFLREWRLFNYEPRDVRFEGVRGLLNLRQFSSAVVPRNEEQCGDAESPGPRDFVMYAGGPIWGLDWCPRACESPDSCGKCEFIAVSAHPPGSSYHNMGAPLSGRGLVQIWCVLNIGESAKDISPTEKPKRVRKKSVVVKEKPNEVKRPRGRPRKNPVKDHVAELDGNGQYMQPLDIRVPENSSQLLAIEGVPSCVQEKNINEQDCLDKGESTCNLQLEATMPGNNSGGWSERINTSQPLVKRPRGRPWKNPVKDHVAELDGNGQYMQPLDIRVPENSSQLLAIECVPSCVQEKNINEQNCLDKGESTCSLQLEATMLGNNSGGGSERNNTSQPLVSEDRHDRSLSSQKVKQPRGRSRKRPLKEHASELATLQPLDTQVTENSSNLLSLGVPGCTREDSVQENVGERIMQTDNVGEGIVSNNTNQLVLSQDQHSSRSSFVREEVVGRSGQDHGLSGSISNDGSLDVSSTDCPLPDDVALPRVVLCLAHNGKVAWDVKWRPLNVEDAKCKHRMGFLAVLLGNGSLEVWEVPRPHTIKALYSSSNGEGTDPRFVKLKPVFRCSMVKSGGVQSIPLTVEWSASAPHDFLLAGCHDGTVALWKFAACVSSNDTRPLLCFSADTAPIRVVSWAPVESDSEGGNVFVTAGHESLKFWDLRDPFRPLWEIQQTSRIIYGLDWLSDPRCLVLSFDDGTMKILSLPKAASDVPVTGKPFTRTKQLSLHSYYGSSYAIWSVQVSRPTGMVAYCGADGTVVRFQLTTNAVDKDFSRNRAPHFLCCSLAKDESSIRIDIPVIGTPFPLKSLNSSRETGLTLRDFLSESSPLERADKKRGKHAPSNDQTLALCYGVYPPEETLASLKKQKPSKSSSSSKKKPEGNLQLVPIDYESPSKDLEDKKEGTHEVLPCKDVAMHRVRWNMNKGSERWLCYGGAAGIVHCQEIVLSEIDQKWAKKK